MQSNHTQRKRERRIARKLAVFLLTGDESDVEGRRGVRFGGFFGHQQFLDKARLTDWLGEMDVGFQLPSSVESSRRVECDEDGCGDCGTMDTYRQPLSIAVLSVLVPASRVQVDRMNAVVSIGRGGLRDRVLVTERRGVDYAHHPASSLPVVGRLSSPG